MDLVFILIRHSFCIANELNCYSRKNSNSYCIYVITIECYLQSTEKFRLFGKCNQKSTNKIFIGFEIIYYEYFHRGYCIIGFKQWLIQTCEKHSHFDLWFCCILNENLDFAQKIVELTLYIVHRIGLFERDPTHFRCLLISIRYTVHAFIVAAFFVVEYFAFCVLFWICFFFIMLVLYFVLLFPVHRLLRHSNFKIKNIRVIVKSLSTRRDETGERWSVVFFFFSFFGVIRMTKLLTIPNWCRSWTVS